MKHRTLRRDMFASRGKGDAKAVPNEAPLVESLQRRGVFVLDTCYCIRLAKSGHGVYDSLKRLSEKGDILVTEQVVKEFQRNVKLKRDVRKEDVAELYQAISTGVVTKEKIDVSEDEHKALSERMGELLEDNNTRLGLGDASIVMLTDVLKGLYERIMVLSEDSDLFTLIPATSGIMVKKTI